MAAPAPLHAGRGHWPNSTHLHPTRSTTSPPPRPHDDGTLGYTTNFHLIDGRDQFDRLYAKEGRPSIAPERLLRASLVQILFSVRSERQLMEQMQYNLLLRWFVGLGIDDQVWGEVRPEISPVG